jgi:nucleoside-triphosphatase
MKQAFLLTGEPGVGKTTLIRQALGGARIKAGGFFTEEIRDRGVRQGFRITTLDGQSAILAHTDFKSPHRVSKYGVDVTGLDSVGVTALKAAMRDCDVVVVDEIGKMELFSPSFKDTVLQALDGGKRVLGTIMLTSHPVADDIKRHPNVAVVSVTRANREQVLSRIVRWLDVPIDGDIDDGRRET